MQTKAQVLSRNISPQSLISTRLQQTCSHSFQTQHSPACSPHTPFRLPFPVLSSAHWATAVPRHSINPSSGLDNSKGPTICMQKPPSCALVIGLRVRTQTSLPTIQEGMVRQNRAGNTSILSLLLSTVLISMPIMPLTVKLWASGHCLLRFALQCSRYGDDS
jgi:hypothetical protein